MTVSSIRSLYQDCLSVMDRQSSEMDTVTTKEEKRNFHGLADGDDDFPRKHRRSERRKKRKKEVDFSVLAECRKMFHTEMVQLGKELVQFRQMCEVEIAKYKSLLTSQREKYNNHTEELKNGYTNNNKDGLSAVEDYWKHKLDDMQADMSYLERKQTQLDREQQLLDKEEELAQKHKELESYAEEVDEIESVLNRRQDLCRKRQLDLLAVEEELQHFREELQESRSNLDEMQDKSDSSSRGKHLWEVARKSLLEKQDMLEATVQKYRTALATSSSNLTAKDIMIEKLDEQVKERIAEAESKDKKIKQLESRLSMTMDESRKLEAQLQSSLSLLDKYSLSDSVNEKSDKSKVKFTLKKQESDSSMNGGPGKTSPVHNSFSSLRRKSSDMYKGDKNLNLSRTSSSSKDSSTKDMRHSLMKKSVDKEESKMELAKFDTKSTACIVM